jgi:hypothetical protein
VRFQPSAYAAPPAFPPDYGAADSRASREVSPETAGQLVEIGGKLTSMGVDAWQRSADKGIDRWRKVAKKKGAAKKRKQAEAQAQAQAAAAAAMTPAPAPAGMSPTMKWGLIAAGVGIVGFALYMLVIRKKETPKPKSNPRRTVRRASAPTRPRDVRPAASEFASRRSAAAGGAASGSADQEGSRESDEEVEELPTESEEGFSGFDDDYGDADGFDGVDEGGE